MKPPDAIPLCLPRSPCRAQSSTGSNLEVDVFGGGPDLDVVSQTSADKGLNLQFHGPKDHLSNDIHEYKVCSSGSSAPQAAGNPNPLPYIPSLSP